MIEARNLKKDHFLIVIFFFFFLAVTLFFTFSSAYAEFSVNASPVDGSSSIRFPTVKSQPVNVEVRIRINSTQNKRYEVRQKLLGDFRNNEGDILGRNAISFYTLSGSNIHGTLYQASPAQLDTFDRVLYSSSPQGDPDTFIIVYQIDPSNISFSGDFFSKMIYTLTPVEAGVSEQNAFLNCYISIERKANFGINTSSHSARTLHFNSRSGGSDGAVEIKWDKGVGRQFQITQLVNEPFRNEKGETFPLEKIYFNAVSQGGESLISAPTALSQKPAQLYVSGGRKDGDSVVINYRVDKDAIKDLPGGNFKARLTYNIESAGGILEQFPMELQLELAPIFEIEVSPELDSGLVFQNIQAGVVVEKEVVLNVKSNMQRPYAVIQNIMTPLTNEKGDTIPLDSFKIKGEVVEGMTGQTMMAQPVAARLADSTVFVSDPEGRSTRFILRYSLEAPKNVKSGNYFARISYALVEK